MEIKVYRPQNPLLQKYIECIYTLTHSPKDDITSYLTFPSVFTIVTVSGNTKTTVTDNRVMIVACPERVIETNLVCNFNRPVIVQYEGKVSEFVFYFKPLGINVFLENSLNHYTKGHFPNFEPFEDYKSAMTDILSIKNVKAKLQNLEDYWSSKLIGFDHPFLFNILDDLKEEENSSRSFSEIASKYGISRMTLFKHFRLHLGKTPSQFRKVMRFRNALQLRMGTPPETALTDIAHHLNYFDESHMIKDFRALTGYPPKDFFSRISRMEDGQINWLFL